MNDEVTDDLERIGKEAAMKVLPRSLPGGTEENLECLSG
jgi:hypothetical protein